jgi:hypothetical protein
MKNYKFLITPLAITLIIAMDQMSKLFLIQYLKSIQGMKISLLSFLDLVFSWNYGISFGLMSNYYQYGNKALLIANSCILIYIFYLLCKSKQKLEILGFAFLHPLKPYIPNGILIKVDNYSEENNSFNDINIIESPYWPERAFHIHTQHPLELTVNYLF